MSIIIDAKAAVVNFFKKEFNVPREAVLVLGIAKLDDGWQGLVQLIQTNQHLKELGYPPVYEKNIYTITLDQKLDVTSYWLGQPEKEED